MLALPLKKLAKLIRCMNGVHTKSLRLCLEAPALIETVHPIFGYPQFRCNFGEA